MIERAKVGFELLCGEGTKIFLQEAKKQAGNPVDVDNNQESKKKINS